MSAHRLHWQTFDAGTGKRATGNVVYATAELAQSAKLQMQSEFPGRVVCVAPIVPKARGIASDKIAAGHPAWQGERRLTQ